MGVSRFLNLPGHHSIFYYLLLLVLVAGVLQALTIGSLFFFKSSGEKRANALYGLLLITFALTLLHYILLITGVLERYPVLSFLPVYFTLSFPTLLFYHVKLNLYPAYHFRWTDGKHFLLPVGQFLFFCVMFCMPVAFKSQLGRQFFNPFYGAFETALYLFTFFLYLFFARRYILQKSKHLATPRDARLVFYLRKLVKYLFILLCIHAAFVLSDFITYEFLSINLRSVKPFAALGILSFAAMLFWLSVYGFQILVWGRKVLA